MFNCLLDEFPDSYQGYPINTSFRVGIMLTLLLEDESVDDDIKPLIAFNLLYKDKVPSDKQIASEGLIWFLTCGKSELYFENEYVDESSPDKCIDFNVDHLDIWGAFWSKGIDLDGYELYKDDSGVVHKKRYDMHWFKFMSALGNLGDCYLTQKMQYRSTDLSKMKGDTKKYYRDLKEKYKIRKVITKEEHDKYLEELKNTNGSYYMKLRELNGGR